MIWENIRKHVVVFYLPAHVLLGLCSFNKNVWINKFQIECSTCSPVFSAAKSLLKSTNTNKWYAATTKSAKSSRHFRADRVVAAQPFLGVWKAGDMLENHGFKGNQPIASIPTWMVDFYGTLPETNVARENRALEKANAIENHHC